jgi:hypothetical protein
MHRIQLYGVVLNEAQGRPSATFICIQYFMAIRSGKICYTVIIESSVCNEYRDNVCDWGLIIFFISPAAEKLTDAQPATNLQ